MRGGVILMKSSIRKMVMAASVANRNDFTLLIAGSTTPALTLLMICRDVTTHENRMIFMDDEEKTDGAQLYVSGISNWESLRSSTAMQKHAPRED